MTLCVFYVCISLAYHQSLLHTRDVRISFSSTGGRVALGLFAVTSVVGLVGTAAWCFKKRRSDFRYSTAEFTESDAIVSFRADVVEQTVA